MNQDDVIDPRDADAEQDEPQPVVLPAPDRAMDGLAEFLRSREPQKID